ncbi:succinyl-diaminopimelate desuccinylase [Halogranum amylolyticum]|uniref:Succinyl-diaminopimelate desuccinylase n=1 Tax=Halogranum amylolyticum TaxID=660520 RepID=A0A1H8N2T2_9EURY|nr:M20/M25/M40 family metallo-hydrolase [Halogranum amylolyticum]SEO23945.1 succinyl-diaminopimelate desuccinylase [Halogranum amylolyticum]
MSSLSPPLSAFLDDSRERLVETALELLSFDTQNPPGETADLIAWLERSLRTAGLETERIAVDETKPNLVARLSGASEHTLLYDGHVDTVPFDATTWVHDPLGERVGERLYGRGATDMKGPLAAMLLAARAYAETETTPPVSLAFAFVSDEETGGAAGLPALVEGGHLAADGCVIGETTCERGRHSVTVADRGSLWLTLEARGTAAHGSRPMLGTNAIDRLYDAVTAIRELLEARPLRLDDDVRATVEESIDYYAPQMGEREARTLFEYPTVNLGTFDGGEAINSVPELATARLDVRVSPGVDTRAILAEVRSRLDEFDDVELTDSRRSVGTFVDVDEPIVSATTALAREATGERVYRRSATGGGDAKQLRNAGIPTVEFALGTDTVHAVDEYTTVDALAGNAFVYTALPYAFADRLQ